MYVGADSQVNVNSTDSTVTLSAGDDFGIGGGDNTINATGNDFVVLSGTGNELDLVDVSGDESGGSTAIGSGTGIYLDPGAQTNVAGGNDTVTLLGNNYLGLLGSSGYTVNATNDTVATWDNTRSATRLRGMAILFVTSAFRDCSMSWPLPVQRAVTPACSRGCRR